MKQLFLNLITTFSLFILTVSVSFSQDYTFKCCNEHNTHKKSCENFNKIQEWEIELDSVLFAEGFKTIKSNFSGIAKIKLNRADSTYKLSITNHNSKKPYLSLEYKYLTSIWSTDCDGNDFPEFSIILNDNGKQILAGGYYWSEADCHSDDYHLQFPNFSYEFFGKVTVID